MTIWGRFYNNGLVVDFAFNWGIVDDSFVLYLDFIEIFLIRQNGLFYYKLEVKGNDVATERFNEQVKIGREWLMPETVLLTLHRHPILNALNIRIINDQPYFYRIGIKDISTEQIFYVTIRGVLMGKDDGNDVLVHLLDYTQNIMDDRKERFFWL